MSAPRVAIENLCQHDRVDAHFAQVRGPLEAGDIMQVATYWCNGGERLVLTGGEFVRQVDEYVQAAIDGLGVKNLLLAPGVGLLLDMSGRTDWLIEIAEPI